MYHQHYFGFFLIFRLLLLRVGGSNAQAAPQPLETIVVGTDTFTVNPTQVVIDSTTLVPGASPVTIDSQAISIDSAFDVFVGGTEVVTASPSLPSSSSSGSSSGSLSASSGSSSSLPSASSVSGGPSSSLISLSDSASATLSASSVSGISPSSSGLSGTDLPTATSLLSASSGSNSLTSIGSSVSGASSTASNSGGSVSSASSSGLSGAGTTAPSGSSTALNLGPLSTTASGSTTNTALPPANSQSGLASTASGSPSVSPSDSAGASGPSAAGPSISPPPPGGSSSSASIASSASSGTDVCVPPGSGSSGSASSGSSGSSGTSGSSGSSGVSSASGSDTLPTCGVVPVTGASSSTGSSSALSSSLSASSNASPGSSATVTSASATSATSGGSSATTSAADTSGLVIPATSIGTSGPAATSQAVILGGVIASFAKQGKAWGSSITIPAVKTQALNDNNQMSINAVAAFTNLGGNLPPKVDACGGSSGLRLKKRSLLSGIENLAGDVLGLAGCAINIASDLSSKIDVPPGTIPDFDAIDADFDGLQQLSEEEENDDDNKSSSKDDSSTATSDSSSSATSATSASSSSGSSSSSSASSSSSFSFSLPPLQTDGLPDFFSANLDSAQVASINSEVSASLAAFESSGTLPSSSGLVSSGSGSGSGSASGSGSSGLSSATSGPASAPASLTTSVSTASSSGVTSAPSYTGPKPTCMLDGAPWMSPTSYCDCGPSSTYSTLPGVPSSVTDMSSALCAYTSLNPSSTITPISTSSAPTNIPGQGGVPGCAAVVWGPAHTDCPYASGINYCNCGGTLAPPLPTSGSFINCDYTIQPTANNCPVNTAYSQSLASVASVSSASAASAASVVSASNAATSFNSATTSTSCGATFGGGGPQAPPTSVPRADTDIVQDGIEHFCTPPQTLTLKKGEPAYQNFALPNTNVIYQIAFEWDPRPECSNAPAPSIVPSVPTGPEYWCNQYLLDLLNGCDAGDGQDKFGGRLWQGCAIYEWEAFVPPDGFNEPILQYSPGNGKRDVEPEKRKLEGVKFARMLDAPVTPWRSYRKELKRSYGKMYQEERRAREFVA